MFQIRLLVFIKNDTYCWTLHLEFIGNDENRVAQKFHQSFHSTSTVPVLSWKKGIMRSLFSGRTSWCQRHRKWLCPPHLLPPHQADEVTDVQVQSVKYVVSRQRPTSHEGVSCAGKISEILPRQFLVTFGWGLMRCLGPLRWTKSKTRTSARLCLLHLKLSSLPQLVTPHFQTSQIRPGHFLCMKVWFDEGLICFGAESQSVLTFNIY